MNVLMLNGSPRSNGNTALALNEMQQVWRSCGIDSEIVQEGRQTMRVLARNMAFLMKSIALGKAQFGLPETEPHVWTHFIRP